MAASDMPAAPDVLIQPIIAELETVAASAAALKETLIALPGLMNDWTIGTPDEVQALPVALLPGPDAVTALWERLGAVGACFVVPDARALGELPVLPGVDTSGIRIIVGETSGDDTRMALDEAARLGVDLRSLADPPSWFAVDAQDRCGYPSAWETARPEHLLVLLDPVAAGGFRFMFEELWRRAATPDAGIPEWHPVLRLLERGRTEAQIAAALHLSERSVRRRIHAASSALGARNRFTLGLAWAESSGPGAAP